MGKRRKYLVGLGILFAGLIVLVLIAPLWIPWLLKPVLAKFHVTFNSYERVGYSRLRLHGVSCAASNATFTAKTVDIHQPTVWLWRHWSNHFTPEDVIVQEWHLAIIESEKRTSRKKPPVHEILERTDHSLEQIIPWVPTATLKSGSITVKGQQISLLHSVWNRGAISTDLTATNFPQPIFLSAQLSTSPKTVKLQIPALEAEANFRITSEINAATDVTGEIRWKTNAAQLTATFGEDSLIPLRASVSAEHLRFPAELLRLQGYGDVRSSISAHWETNRFALDLKANAAPLDETNLPPVTLDVHATGDTNLITVEEASLSAAWLNARLSTNVVFNFSGELISPEAALHVALDLSKQSVIEAVGKFNGDAFLQRSDGKYPYARFRLNSEGFSGYDVRLDAVQISGELDWPWLTLESAHIVFADGGVAHAAGRYQMIDRTFAPSTIKLNGQVGHEFLPPDLTYTNIALSASFNGPLVAPLHSGEIEVSGVRHKETGPFRLASAWEGKLMQFTKLSAEAEVRDTLISVAGAGSIKTNSIALHLEHAALRKGAENIFELLHPTDLRVEKNEAWNLKVDELALGGAAQLLLSADINWPRRGSIQLFGTNVNSALIEDYLGPNTPQINLNHLALQAAWSNGPVEFKAAGDARFSYEKTNTFLARLDAASDENGVDLQQFEVLAKIGPVLSGKGRLPLRIVPGNETNTFQLSRTDPIDFHARTLPNEQLWDEIARLTNIRVKDPDLQLEISGSLGDPRGYVKFEATSARWAKAGGVRFPDLTDIRADLNLSEGRIQLTRFAGALEGQPISLQMELPIGKNVDQNWRKLFDWRKATGRIWIENASFAPFVKYLPDILVPQGTMDANISFSNGLMLNGILTVKDAATRPLPNSGPLQDINARIRFVKRAIEFEDVHALLGGQPVNFLGRIDFATNAPGNLPLIDLFLQGENIPLARRTDLILRSDLNLRLSNVTNAVPLVSGHVRLRDSFYLGDLRQLIPGRVSSPKRRPPYFSFEEQPFADWVMNVQVTGDNFLRARSPLFRGTMSANLQITGPLKEPVALGDARTETGTVVFPFANFNVVQGYVTLTSDDPYRPQVLMNGTSRAFGYDLAMTLTGPADRPVVEFTSTPPLTSEQIILMVTAGEVPRRGFGFNTEQRAQRLALFVGKNILSRFSDNAGAERLSITTGEEISEQGRETYALEYRINETWSIVGEYDRFGALNVGMKWRIYSR